MSSQHDCACPLWPLMDMKGSVPTTRLSVECRICKEVAGLQKSHARLKLIRKTKNAEKTCTHKFQNNTPCALNVFDFPMAFDP